ncbi:hypothetical protein DMENIID0001_170310 [Sergentomyia squamirostris]
MTLFFCGEDETQEWSYINKFPEMPGHRMFNRWYTESQKQRKFTQSGWDGCCSAALGQSGVKAAPGPITKRMRHHPQ